MASLFTPFEIKGLTIRNRVVLPPMAMDQAEEDGSITQKNIEHYGRLAGAGMGLLVVEHNFIQPEGRVSGKQMSISRDEDIPRHRALVEEVHRQGVPVALQISHAGSNRVNPPFTDGMGPSALVHPGSGIVPRELATREIAGLVEAFGQAAGRAKSAGYDLVEIHCAHGYLLSQFLSPLTNGRKDVYGGELRNRCRLLLEVVEEVRGIVGEDYLLIVRLGIADNPPDLILFPGGLTAEEGGKVAQALAEAKIDILDLSAGMCGSRPKGVSGEGYFLAFAEIVRERVKLPLVITGGVTQGKTAEAIVASGKTDFVGVGRALAANLEWVRQARSMLK